MMTMKLNGQNIFWFVEFLHHLKSIVYFSSYAISFFVCVWMFFTGFVFFRTPIPFVFSIFAFRQLKISFNFAIYYYHHQMIYCNTSIGPIDTIMVCVCVCMCANESLMHALQHRSILFVFEFFFSHQFYKFLFFFIQFFFRQG